MIDIENAKKEFFKYAENYDTNNSKIKLKIHHSLRVMECSKKIAQDLNLTKEQIDLATLIGLLHDIARFEQMKRYNTFYDKLSVDHGDLAVEILEENNFIRNFIETDEYDEIIKIAVKNHNKYQIKDGLEGEVLLQSKIIRDADKLDIFYEGKDLFWKEEKEIQEIENSEITDYVYNSFICQKTIERKNDQTRADRVTLFIAFIFDINFKYTAKKILENKYVDYILDRFNFKNEETKNKFIKIREIANEFLRKY